MKRTLPSNPMSTPAAPPVAPSDQDEGFQNFQHNTNFLRTVLNPHAPEPNTGVHVPVWLSPKLAQAVIAKHGHTGHAIPHPNINLQRLDK